MYDKWGIILYSLYLIKEGAISELFLKDKSFSVCKTTSVFTEYPETSSRTFTINSDDLIGSKELKVEAFLRNHQTEESFSLNVSPNPISFELNSNSTFAIDYDWNKINGTHSIITLKIGDVYTIEYVKQCHAIPDQILQHFISSLSLLIIATIVLAIGVRQGRLKMLSGVREAEMYEIYTISAWHLCGIVATASFALMLFYFIITYLSLSWLITLFFMFSWSWLMIPFIVDIISYFAHGNVKSICNFKIGNLDISVKWVISVLITFSIQ